VDTPRLLKNRYRLGTVIGRGGMGVVWLATDDVLDRPVAVKEVVFPPGLPDEEQDTLRRRTLREARTNARLNHPNVVGVYDIVDEEGRPWIVMEFVPSRSLAETVRADGPFSPQRTAEIGLQLLRGLRAAHAAGVLHRDVKPSNVLLAEDGRVVLGDFGIATAKGGSTVTSSGVLIGSPSYMAPERARGRDVGPESDLWSLGATLYTAMEGRPPFDRDSAVATLAALVMDAPDPPRHAGPLWPLISSLLRRDPAERPSAEAVATSLRQIAEPSRGARVPGASARPPSVPRPRAPLDEASSLPGPPVGPLRPENGSPVAERANGPRPSSGGRAATGAAGTVGSAPPAASSGTGATAD
jgi:eukaryotic-like serine/threonine-protein kinase